MVNRAEIYKSKTVEVNTSTVDTGGPGRSSCEPLILRICRGLTGRIVAETAALMQVSSLNLIRSLRESGQSH